ncbi:SGNH/GDSL hydrolase family protein [Geminisphaera colitermitum]|uniref:SGNH/GDSL hydrolase family protein n=1 Tax=Geminisphaera colitermitum TaxID=1148786 RepID=UPI00019650B8|nr:SGNH/GDSL hydrolase family protein [Geminisphaera colitermitum]
MICLLGILTLTVGCGTALPQDLHNSGAAPRQFAVRLAAKARPIRVAFIGDEITSGYGATTTLATYHRQVELISRKEIKCLSYAGQGMAVGRTAKRPFKKDILHDYSLTTKPDLYVIMLGVNDAANPQWSRDMFKRDYLEIIHAYQSLAHKPRVVLCLTPWVREQNPYNADCAILKQVNATIAEIAREAGLPLIDMWTKTETIMAASTDAQGYPTNEAHSEMANIVFAEIGQYRSIRTL